MVGFKYEFYIKNEWFLFFVLGQNKRKTKKGEEEFEPGFIITSITPDFEYYSQGKPRRNNLVKCGVVYMYISLASV